MTTLALVVGHRDRQRLRPSNRYWIETPPMERFTCSIGGFVLWPIVIHGSLMVRKANSCDCPCFGPLASPTTCKLTSPTIVAKLS